MLDRLKTRGFEVRCESHAAAILEHDFAAALKDLDTALLNLKVPITEIIGSGGGETQGTQRMRHAFNDVGWKKFVFEIRKIINGVEREATSHEVDHVKEFDGYKLALEIEWNNKDPFFDRDLENFKRLHAEGAISVGVVVTRGSLLHGGMREFVARFAKEQEIHSFEDLQLLVSFGRNLAPRLCCRGRRRMNRSPILNYTSLLLKVCGSVCMILLFCSLYFLASRYLGEIHLSLQVKQADVFVRHPEKAKQRLE